MPLTLLVVATAALAASAPLSDEVLARARQPLPKLTSSEVEWTWLGIAGVRIRTNDDILFVDPYLTRARLPELLLSRVTPNEALLDELLPAADVILIGHSHYDHLADAPYLASKTGALILGSRTTCHLSRALGGPHCTTPRENSVVSVTRDIDVTRLAARHGDLGVLKLFGGDRVLHAQPEGAVHPLLDMPAGEAQAWLVVVKREERPPLRVFVHTSAGLDPPSEDTLVSARADLAFVSASLTHLEDRWAERMTKAVKPGGTLVLVHYESLWTTLSDDMPLNEGLPDLNALIADIERVRPDLRVVVPKAFERNRL